MKATPEEVRNALALGKITAREAEYYLEKECGMSISAQDDSSTIENARPGEKEITPPHTTPSAITQTTPTNNSYKTYTILLLIALIVIAGLFIVRFEGGTAGLVTLNINSFFGGENATNNTYAITENVTGLNVSGTLYGEGDASIWFDTPGGRLLIGTVTSDDGTPRTDKAGYATGENVSIEHAPLDATYYLDDGAQTIAVTLPFPAPAASGTLLIVANESGSLSTYRLPIIIGTAERATTFENLCADTCSINATTGIITAEVSDGARLLITGVALDAVHTNRPPQQAVPLPTLTVNQSASIDLSPYFMDPDGDALLYSTGSSDLVNASVTGSELTLTALTDGNGTMTIYVSDLKELVTAPLDIVSIGATPIIVENASVNTTGNVTMSNVTANETTNVTPVENVTTPIENITTPFENVTTPTENITIPTNETNVTAPNTTLVALDCSDPNPNNRPLECVQNSSTNYFPDQEIYWYDTGRTAVARFSPIGNLIITGDVIPDSTGTAQAGMFSIGYADDNGNIVPTVWIDNDGNLQLRGMLHEENEQIIPAPNSYSFNNRKGITLAYANLATGDLYIRGNVIPFRRSIG
jgi:hypothetical protein